ncbi:hypothetical protein EDB19DRAFT_1832675 [Suillus lakei]|nr:hypothetical protein EDB19DRAFT_1832675 [Suillus lakei]
MSSSVQDLSPQLNLGNMFGALFIGVILSAVLFGLTNIQTFIYFQTHRGTGMTFFKLIVIWLWVLDALHLTLIVHCTYYNLVTNYVQSNALTKVVWSLKPCSTCDVDGLAQLLVIVDVLVIPTVHLYFTPNDDLPHLM